MKKICIILAIPTILLSCKKEKESTPINIESTKTEIVQNIGNEVISESYNDLSGKSEELFKKVENFNIAPTDENLVEAQEAWLNLRAVWEKTEGFLFGPVAVDNIDPRVDTWPVNYQAIDSVLASSSTFTSEYIDNLEDALKGFHPIEYLLFGKNKSRKAEELTIRQKEYLLALGANLKELCKQPSLAWKADYLNQFTTPGNSSVYKTQGEVYQELTNAIVGICDEVANGKIKEPFLAADASLEESPFALNSTTDFYNNIESVENIYLGKYKTDGKGLEDFVKFYNLSLDQKIKTEINEAKASLKNITLPFGTAITAQGTQVQNSIDAINKLKATLEEELLPLVQLHIK